MSDARTSESRCGASRTSALERTDTVERGISADRAMPAIMAKVGAVWRSVM